MITLFSMAVLAETETDKSSKTDVWAQTADQVQALIESGTATRWAIEKSRARLAEQRSEALEIAKSGNIRVKALEAQLGALGLVPADGAAESDDIAARRVTLAAEISKANAPILAASEAVQRANVLIDELDALLIEKRAADMLVRYPTPLRIDTWPHAMGAFADWLGAGIVGVKESVSAPARKQQLAQTLPLVIFLCVGALTILIMIQPMILRRLDHSQAEGPNNRFQMFPNLARNLARLIIPAVGAAGLVAAWQIAQLLPSVGPVLNAAAVAIAVDIVLAVWLGYMIFSPASSDHQFLKLTDEEAKTGQRVVVFIGLISGLDVLARTMDIHSTLNDETIAIVTAPIMLVASILFWRLAGFLRPRSEAGDDGQLGLSNTSDTLSDTNIGSAFRQYLSYALFLAAISIGLSILAGYVRLSREIFDSSVQTLAILAIASILYRALLYALSGPFRHRQVNVENRQSLLPVFIIVVLTVIILPLLSLAWGARRTDLADLWQMINEGFQIGDIRLSLDSFLTLVVVFVIGAILTRWLQRVLKTSVLPRTRMDIGARNATVTGTGYLGITLAAIIALSSAGLNLSSLAIVAGALSVGIGFGMQTIVSNFVSGIILLIERPIKHGDWIEVSGYSGTVRKISVRSTRIETFDRHDVVIPNSDLISGTVKNMTLTSQTGRVTVPVGVAYGCDVETARQIMLDAALNHADVLKTPAPTVLFIALGDSALQFELRCFLRNVDKTLSARSDLLMEIYTNLRNAGIEIPFPQRDIHIRSGQKDSGTPVI